MDTVMTSTFSVSSSDLLPLIGKANAPMLLDVRRDAAFQASPHMIAGAMRCAPQDVAAWAAANSALIGKAVVAYCVYGHQVSQGVAEQLRALGFQALFLAGGIEGGEEGADSRTDIAAWRAVKLPVIAKEPQTKFASS